MFLRAGAGGTWNGCKAVESTSQVAVPVYSPTTLAARVRERGRRRRRSEKEGDREMGNGDKNGRRE